MKIIRKWVGKIYSTVIRLYDHLSATSCTVSVGDIVLQRAEFDHCQFLLTTRKLDVATYINKNNKTFPYQNAISRAVYGADHKEEHGNRQFTNLIESYKKNGYDSGSFVTVDKECRLIDGNHRMGINLFMGIETINVRFLCRSSAFPRNLDKFLNLGMTSSFMAEVVKEYELIQKWLINTGNTFCCLLCGIYECDNVSLVEDLKLISNVCAITTVSKTTNGRQCEGVLVQFSLDFPAYCIKDGQLISQRTIQIENNLLKRKAKFNLDVDIIVSKSCLEGNKIWKECFQ